jgi:hypothetical protein
MRTWTIPVTGDLLRRTAAVMACTAGFLILIAFAVT